MAHEDSKRSGPARFAYWTVPKCVNNYTLSQNTGKVIGMLYGGQ